MNERLEEYICGHISPEPPALKELERLSNIRYVNGRMCSGHIQGRLLKMLVSMINPKRVLEIGTFTGYSALCIAEGMSVDSSLETIEVDDELEEFILDNIAASDSGGKIRLHIGDALQIMGRWKEEEFDLIFIDADKREYSQYFKAALPLVKKGGYIIADNTLWDSHVVEEGKHSRQTSGIIEFNDMIVSLPGLEIAMVPVRDGLTLIKKVK